MQEKDPHSCSSGMKDLDSPGYAMMDDRVSVSLRCVP